MNKKLHRGFTLIEMLVAVFIFSLALVSLMTIASRGIRNNRTVADEISAQYLAAEGIEIARHIRDSNIVAGTAWDTGLTGCFPDACYWEWAGGSGIYAYVLNSCNASQCNDPVLITQPIQIGVNVSGGSPTSSVLIPSLTIEAIDADELLVTSEIIWQQGRLTRVTKMQEILRNWQN